MPRNDIPYCDVDWARTFSLPFGVPASGITAAERIQYAVGLGAVSEIPVSTHGSFFADPPALDVRLVDGILLPRYGRDLVPSISQLQDATKVAGRVQSFGKAAFKPIAVPSGTASAVEHLLQARLPIDDTALAFAPLPIPRLALDSIETFFPSAPAAWKPGAPFKVPGALDAAGAPVAAVPQLLLESSDTALGEHDPLLLRAPVAGRFRFDPYYLFRRVGTALEAIGPSSTGRLLVQQPPLSTARKNAGTSTEVFESRTFAFEHVTRDSVAELLHVHLMFQLCHLKALDAAHHGKAGSEARLAIPKHSAEIMDWAVSGVHRLIRSWTAFLWSLAWRIEDKALTSALPAEWAKPLAKDDLKAGDAATVVTLAKQVLDDAERLASLIYFCSNVYSRRLSGFSWSEVLELNGRNTDRFPVPADQPPFTGTDAAAKAAQLQHQWLRLLENPHDRWVACWAGAPLGRPAPIYAPTPAAAGAGFPANAVTTYDLEALHAATKAGAALAVASPDTTTQAAPGRAADLSSLVAKRVGYACWFSAGPIWNPLHTTVDWLLELTQGVHQAEQEPGFLQLMSLVDTADAAFRGHPLVRPLGADVHERALHLRGQMNSLDGDAALRGWVDWWGAAYGLKKVGSEWFVQDPLGNAVGDKLTPTLPYKAERTVPAPGKRTLDHTDLNTGAISGFDAFDIESAFLARRRMTLPPGAGPMLPLSVILALMDREGVRSFGAINRFVTYTAAQASTLAWIATDAPLHRTASYDVPPLGHVATPAEISRIHWLSLPYGLDHFILERSPADPRVIVDVFISDQRMRPRIVALESSPQVTTLGEENVERYLRSRMWSDWQPEAPPPADPKIGRPVIWKLHRRVHWAVISMMVGFFRRMELEIGQSLVDVGAFRQVGWKPVAWFPGGMAPPILVGKAPTDIEWKDFISYYAIIYAAYNTSPANWRRILRQAEAQHLATGSSLTLRDFLLFKFDRRDAVVDHMARFAVGLDSFMRLDDADGVALDDFAARGPSTIPPDTRAWGV